MSEDKKSLIDLVPDSVYNAVKNITDKPTQNIGTTLADIWYLVFGGISQAAEKRKLKYYYSLQEFEKELKDKISKIPKENLTEVDMQIIAQSLEASKYCVEKEYLRKMFSNLISISMDVETQKQCHPSFIYIIESMTSLEAEILKSMYDFNNIEQLSIKTSDDSILFFLSSLERNGLINLLKPPKSFVELTFTSKGKLEKVHSSLIHPQSVQVAYVGFTKLGDEFCNICL